MSFLAIILQFCNCLFIRLFFQLEWAPWRLRTLPFLSFAFLITDRPSVNTIRKWMRKLRFRVVQWISLTQLVNVISGLGLRCSDSGLVSHLPQNVWGLKFSSLLGWGMGRYSNGPIHWYQRGHNPADRAGIWRGSAQTRMTSTLGWQHWEKVLEDIGEPSPGSIKPLQRSQSNKIQKSRRTIDSAMWHQINLSEGFG